MACCGSSNKFDEKKMKQLQSQLRATSETIELKLDNLKLNFIPDSSEWKSNYIYQIILFFINSEYKRSFSRIFIG